MHLRRMGYAVLLCLVVFLFKTLGRKLEGNKYIKPVNNTIIRILIKIARKQ